MCAGSSFTLGTGSEVTSAAFVDFDGSGGGGTCRSCVEGSGAFVGSDTRAGGGVCSRWLGTGQPQCGHAEAFVESLPSHSGHVIKVILSSPRLLSMGRCGRAYRSFHAPSQITRYSYNPDYRFVVWRMSFRIQDSSSCRTRPSLL